MFRRRRRPQSIASRILKYFGISSPLMGLIMFLSYFGYNVPGVSPAPRPGAPAGDVATQGAGFQSRNPQEFDEAAPVRRLVDNVLTKISEKIEADNSVKDRAPSTSRSPDLAPAKITRAGAGKAENKGFPPVFEYDRPQRVSDRRREPPPRYGDAFTPLSR